MGGGGTRDGLQPQAPQVMVPLDYTSLVELAAPRQLFPRHARILNIH